MPGENAAYGMKRLYVRCRYVGESSAICFLGGSPGKGIRSRGGSWERIQIVSIRGRTALGKSGSLARVLFARFCAPEGCEMQVRVTAGGCKSSFRED